MQIFLIIYLLWFAIFQAWTAVQVFKEKYANTATFQLPLFKGPPSQQMLKQLAREPCKEWMEKNIRNGTVII